MSDIRIISKKGCIYITMERVQNLQGEGRGKLYLAKNITQKTKQFAENII